MTTPAQREDAERARRQSLWAAGVAVVLVLTTAAFIVVAGSRSQTSADGSVSVVPSPESSDGLSTDDLPCTTEQEQTLEAAQSALPWPIEDDELARGSRESDLTCVGTLITVDKPYEDVVAGLPAALAPAGIDVVPGVGSMDATTFTGTSASGLAVGILVAPGPTAGTSGIGVTVSPPGSVPSG